MSDGTSMFAASMAENYHRYLVPLMFDAYAADLAKRVAVPDGGVILELACGTGATTRHLRSVLPDTVRIVATDLNDGMLDIARYTIGATDGVAFQLADATDLPFGDAAFDAVVCQFGVMFFPDRQRGFAEAARVLKPGGRLHFNVWDSLAHNPLARLAHEVMSALSDDDPITFLAMPYNHTDLNEIRTTLESTGFGSLEIAVCPKESRAASSDEVVAGMIHGSILSTELESRGLMESGKRAMKTAMAAAFGDGPIVAPMQAIVFSATH